jgi:hypothetical protein
MKRLTLKRLACWLLALFLAGGPAAAQTLDKAERQAVVARAGQLLADNYVYPDRARAARDAIAQTLAAGGYDGIDDPAAFAKRLTEDLRGVLHDKHIFVSFQGAPAPNLGPAFVPPPSNGGFVRVDRLKGNIGYIKLNSFPAMAIFAPAADEAMRDIAGTDALILDMRDNGGGSAESDAYFGSFFFDPQKPVQLNSIVHRNAGTETFATAEFWTRPVASPFVGKPVYVLTSARTFSGGEAVVYDLKAQKRAIVYGETTSGGANPGGSHPLNARFGIAIPSGRALNPITGTNWEGTGVSPDVSVDAAHAFDAALRDIAAKRGLGVVTAQLATETQIDPFVEAHLLKIRTLPRPGAEAAVRRNIEDLAQGTPHYETMSKDLADITRQQLPRLQQDLSRMGAIKSVTFRYVGPAGLDVFDVAMANGTVQSGIFIQADGRIEAVWVRPLAAPPSP